MQFTEKQPENQEAEAVNGVFCHGCFRNLPTKRK